MELSSVWVRELFSWGVNCHYKQWYLLANLCKPCSLYWICSSCSSRKSRQVSKFIYFFDIYLLCLYVTGEEDTCLLTWVQITTCRINSLLCNWVLGTVVANAAVCWAISGTGFYTYSALLTFLLYFVKPRQPTKQWTKHCLRHLPILWCTCSYNSQIEAILRSPAVGLELFI